MLNYLPNLILDCKGAVKKVIEANDPPVGQQDVLVGGRPADRGFVQVDAERDLGTGQRLQVADAAVQELPLAIDQAIRDLAQGAPALLDAIDEELGPAGTAADELAVIRRQVSAVADEL